MPPKTTEQLLTRYAKTFHAALDVGWTKVDGWIFESPSGSKHDLSAADFTKLDSIERCGSFLVE